MHSSLPGLTRLEQMFLVALADTVATTSAEVASSTDQQYTGQLYIYRHVLVWFMFLQLYILSQNLYIYFILWSNENAFSNFCFKQPGTFFKLNFLLLDVDLSIQIHAAVTEQSKLSCWK